MKEYNETTKHDDQFADIRTFLGEEMNIDDAAEPTDIIWENRHFTGFQRFQRSLIVIGVVFLLLLGSFTIVFLCSSLSASSYFKYPEVDCDETYADYSGNDESLTKLAFKEYFANRKASTNYTEEVEDY